MPKNSTSSYHQIDDFRCFISCSFIREPDKVRNFPCYRKVIKCWCTYVSSRQLVENEYSRLYSQEFDFVVIVYLFALSSIPCSVLYYRDSHSWLPQPCSFLLHLVNGNGNLRRRKAWGIYFPFYLFQGHLWQQLCFF